jgi:hypothetical protein
MTRRIDRRAIARQRQGLQPRQTRDTIALQAPAGVGGSAPRKPTARTTTKASGSRGFYSNSVRWRSYALAYLLEHPVCMCEDRCGQRSAFVDHIIPIKDPTDLADPMIWAPNNHQALSDRCHRIKSRIELGRAGKLAPVRRKSLRVKGCTPDGMPNDKNHWWWNEK